ncbi:MAG TPA: dienelactone hydrolase family protein [Dehalococcoidia bacterium]
MPEMHDLQRYLVEEFTDAYLEGHMSRRDLLRRVLLMTGSAAVTASALGSLGVRSRVAEAASPIHPRPLQPAGPVPAAVLAQMQADPGAPPSQQTTDNVVDPNDPSIMAGMVTFGGAAGDLFGYLAQPADGAVHPGIVVVHENRGLIEPNMDICRRYAKEGYAALCVDLVSRAGGTAQFMDDIAQATGFLGSANPDDLVSDLVSGANHLSQQPQVDSTLLGATGFCFGGGLVWRLVEQEPNLKAAVPYYGPNPPLENVPNIAAPVLGIYAELDTRITGSSTDLDAALDAAGKVHDKWIAPGANHAFFNNTGQAYNPADAMEAWSRTLAWFAQYLVHGTTGQRTGK